MASLVVLSGLTGAALFSPPYRGNVTSFGAHAAVGCGQFRVTLRPTFHLSSGSGGGALGSAVRSPCGGSWGSPAKEQLASVLYGFEAAIALRMRRGATNVSAQWTFKFTVSSSVSNATPSQCPTRTVHHVDRADPRLDYNYTHGLCWISALASVRLDPVVEDLTNGTTFPLVWSSLSRCFPGPFGLVCGDPAWGNGSSRVANISYYEYGPGSVVCASGCQVDRNASGGSPWTSMATNVSASGTTSSTSYLNGSNPGWVYDPAHRYVLLVSLYVFSQVVRVGWRHATASAAVNADPALGLGWMLSKISIT